jgi:L-iditol 2-dehydrogenase
VHGIEECRLREGQHALIIGSGPIGLMFVALAKQMGCIVTIAGRGNERLTAARRLGADHRIDMTGKQDLLAEVGGGEPTRYDVVIEAVGSPDLWEASVQLVRKGGAVNFFGGCPSGTSVRLDTGRIHYSNLTLMGSFHHTPRTIRRALQWIEDGVIQSRLFINGECGLHELPELFRSMKNGNRAVKTLVKMPHSPR